MNSFKILAVIAVLMTLLSACSDVPAKSDVKDLIKTQYKQANTMTNEAMTVADNDKSNDAFDEVIKSAMPILDSVDNVNCDAIDAGKNDKGDDSYLCTADITQTMNGHTSINQVNFKVYKVDDKWILNMSRIN